MRRNKRTGTHLSIGHLLAETVERLVLVILVLIVIPLRCGRTGTVAGAGKLYRDRSYRRSDLSYNA